MQTKITAFLASVVLLSSAVLSGETVLFEKVFTRTKGKPTAVQAEFPISDPVGEYIFHIENGSKSSRVSSAVVWVNGEKVFREKDFNQKVQSLRKTVSLRQENSLKCILGGKPGGTFKLRVLGNIPKPPTVEISSPADSSCYNTSPVDVSWQVNGIKQTTQNSESLIEGQNIITRTATDAGGTGSASVKVILDTQKPVIHGFLPKNGSILNTARPTISVSVSDELSGIDVSSIELIMDGEDVDISDVSGTQIRYTPEFDLSDGMHTVELSLQDLAGNASQTSVSFRTVSAPLPSDPVEAAPELDNTVVTDMKSATSFLYEGDDPIQTGVASDVIEPKRAAVIRGKVLDVNGDPLYGVKVSVHGHSEFGQTLTRIDGMFELAVNGGGHLVLEYEKGQYFKAQRQVHVPWQDYVWAPDVVMIQPDSKVSSVSVVNTTEMQVARGSVVSDNDGARQATVLFPEGTQVTNFNAETINIRATEYTVGDNGPQAMPAHLPSQIGYTYCVELSADEAENVEFNQPVFVYVENFLKFPVGGIVPSGYYDKRKAVWVPSKNGRIIEILSIENGSAVVDVDGSGVAADAQAMADLGIDDEELQQLAHLYTAGQSLWRVPVTHFTPWDFNWPVAPPEDAVEPKLPEPKIDNTLDKPSIECGSIIEIQNQMLGEKVNVVGTPFSVNYSSGRVSGRKTAYHLEIPLVEEKIPSSVKRIDLKVKVAGRIFLDSFVPEPNLNTKFVWDGYDAFGRELQGRYPVVVEIGYVYNGVFQRPNNQETSFSNSGLSALAIPAREEITLWQNHWGTVGTIKSQTLGIWSLNNHHVYSPISEELWFGDGHWRKAPKEYSTHAGTGECDLNVSGDGLALNEPLCLPRQLATGADGSVFVVGSGKFKVFRISNNGDIVTIAGRDTWTIGGDDTLATNTNLGNPEGIAVDDEYLYIVENWNHRIRKVDLNTGIITTIAGTGEAGYSGDGGLAINAKLNWPSGIALSPDGVVYITDSYNGRIRKIDANGIISTIAGNGVEESVLKEGLAEEAILYAPNSITVDHEGNIYFYEGRCIRKISVDGWITTIAGTGEEGFSGDGGPAVDATISWCEGIICTQEGKIIFNDVGNNRIRCIEPDGKIFTVAGNGTDGSSDTNIVATAAVISEPGGITLGPDNALYFSEPYNHKVRKITSLYSETSFGDHLIPSEDGSQIFHFNPNGKHLRTLDALTGKAIYTFNYNDSGLLSSITDIDSNITTIERDAQGNPTAIIAPFGQRTELTVNSDGYLSSITNPAGETTNCTYHEGGLLASFTNPEGNTSTFTYDDMGRLIKDENAAGGYTALERTETELGFEIKKTIKAENDKVYETVYLTENLPAGGMRQVTYNCCGGGTVETIIGTDGTTKTISPDGTVTETVEGPDPRFGMQAPIIKRKTITTPSGLVYEMTSSRAAVLEDDNDPLSIQTLIDSVDVNGDTYITTYDAQSKTITSTSPENRQSVTVMDDKGKMIQSEIPGQAPSVYDYDARGRMISVTQGTGVNVRQSTITYNNEGFMESMTDATGRTVSLSYDAAGRILTETHPDGRQASFTYDQNGNLTTLTPPGRPEHSFGYTNVEMLETYSPPTVGAGSNFTRYSYNLNKQLVNISRPDGQMLDFLYDDIGRLTEVYLPTGQVNYIYSDTTNTLRSIVSPDGTLSYNYDGALVAGVEWSGLVNGSVGVNFNTAFQITSQSINGQAEIAFGYDSDGLLESIGQMIFSLNPQDGKLTGTALENVSDSYSYNEFGNQVSYTALAGGSQLYEVTHTGIDKLGRITSRTETVEGQTTSYSYNYDVAGQLIEVYRNGALYSSYGYDENGNRTDYFGPAGTVTASYDDQDRMLTYGDATYQYTANGELQSKTDNSGTTQYEYDVLENLKTVTLPDGTLIEYLADGRNRRIGVKVDGTLEKGFLYQDQLNPVAELDGAGNVESRFVYGTRANVPDYMVKGGVVYRIISDHLGSVRLVVNAHTGAIAQRMDYDEFGNVLLDNNPGFQPFGFAGGIYDHRTGLVRFGARDYDAETGRWTCKDPIRFDGGDGNLYRYCNNSPFMYYDPSGLLGDELMLAGTLITGVGFALNPASPLLIAVGGVTLIAGTGIRLWEAYNIEGQKAKNAYQNAIDKAYEKYPDEFLDEEFRKNRDKRHNRNKCND